MKFDLTKVQYSNNDKKRKITIPESLSSELAELIGIIMGDGHVGRYISNKKENRFIHYVIEIYGHSDEERYYTGRVCDLFKEIFNIDLTIYHYKRQKCLRVRVGSKAIYSFFANIIKVPQQKKNVSVPSCIKKSNLLCKAAFLRGLTDTDFCCTIKHKPNPYPVIQGGFSSYSLVKDCSLIFDELGIKVNVQKEKVYHKRTKKYYQSNRLYINGHKRIIKFSDVIGFNNLKKAVKLEKIIKNGPGGI
jgi:hypothetical protein